MSEAEAEKKARVDAVWDKYDADKNGTLEKAECLNFLRDTFKEVFGSEQTDEQLESTFNMVDTNKNGVIDKAEMMQHINGIVDGEAEVD